MNRNGHHTGDDFHDRAIPTIPGQRTPDPRDDYDSAAALARFPRPQDRRHGTDQD